MTIKFILREAGVVAFTMSVLTVILLLIDQPIFPAFWYGLFGVGITVVLDALETKRVRRNSRNEDTFN